MAALNTEIPAALKKDLERACVERDRTLKSAVAEAVQQWLYLAQGKSVTHIEGLPKDIEPKPAQGGTIAPSGQWAREISALIEVLTSEQPTFVAAIRSNLIAFQRAVRIERAAGGRAEADKLAEARGVEDTLDEARNPPQGKGKTGSPRKRVGE